MYYCGCQSVTQTRLHNLGSSYNPRPQITWGLVGGLSDILGLYHSLHVAIGHHQHVRILEADYKPREKPRAIEYDISTAGRSGSGLCTVFVFVCLCVCRLKPNVGW